MTKKIAGLILAGAMTLLAQRPAGNPERGPFDTTAVQTYLGLTDGQVSQLNDVLTAERNANQPLYDQLAADMKSLHDLLNADNPDATAIAAIQAEIKDIQSKLADSRANYRTQALALLTADQKTKLATLEEASKLQPAIMSAGALNLLEGGRPFGGPCPGMGPGPNGMRFGTFGRRPPVR